MFSSLGNNLTAVFDKLKGKGYLSESDVSDAMREIRIALLEADVALPVARELVKNIKEKATGQEVIKSISPGQMVVKIVNDELVKILGAQDREINLAAKPPAVILMLGLQGSGKTTSSAKLALNLRKKNKKKVLLASLDTYRPAAQEQLELLAKQVTIDSLPIIKDQSPQDITKRAMEEARLGGFDVLILDTAGRLHNDEQMIQELQEIKKMSSPVESLLTVDCLTGQDAVNIGKEFNEKIGITGVVLTRVDGDSRGGVALSMTHITNTPIKFIGVGEKLNELEEFHPERATSRILKMGDVVSLVEKASEAISEKEAEILAKKVKKGSFDMDDLLKQLKNLKKMGGVSSLMSMIPGIGKMKKQLQDTPGSENILKKQEAIISSMTLKERRFPKLINASRKKRIAMGSGNQVQDVNRLLKQFAEMSKMMKKFSGMDSKQLSKMENMLGDKRF